MSLSSGGEDAQGPLAQEQAGAARARLAVARTQGAAWRAWAGKAWARADQSAQEAERAWQEQRYAEAVGLYEWALRAYTEAGAAAEAARDEQQAVEARTQAERSESVARAAGAPQFAQARFAKAAAAHQDGARDLQNRHWEDARRRYAEAQRLYLEAREEAERARTRTAAEAALEGARAARAALQQAAAPKTIAARIEQAEALFAEAQTALGREHWKDARAAFDTSATRFRQLREEAIVHQAREGAVQARAQALRLQGDIGPAGGWRMARAKGALARGHRLFETANYAEARASFEKAASHFEVRLKAAARRRREPRLAVPWAKVLPFLGLGALAAGVAFYLMRAEREPLPVEPPVSTVPEAAAPPVVEPAAPAPEPLRLRPSPDAGAPIALAEGASQTFAIDVQGTVSRPLRYTWFLDDAPQMSARPTWSYTPDFDAAGERLKEIKVVVSDANAVKAEIRWRVKVLGTNMPQFPWPPPDASAIAHIPDEFFRKSKADIVHLRDIEVRLNTALEASGYEKSYYAVPGGFALAARLEQINLDGTPKSGLDRWSTEVGLLRAFSLRAIAQALFASNPGYFRIIVFVVTPYPVFQSDVQVEVEREEAMKWPSRGVNQLPESVAMQPYSADYSCTALIYEFEKVSRLATASTLIPGKIPGKVHLEKAALWDRLRK